MFKVDLGSASYSSGQSYPVLRRIVDDHSRNISKREHAEHTQTALAPGSFWSRTEFIRPCFYESRGFPSSGHVTMVCQTRFCLTRSLARSVMCVIMRFVVAVHRVF